MSNQSGAVRNPANDLTSFDISKRSPEQIAELFARWKKQRKRVEIPEPPKSDGRAVHHPMRTEVSAPHDEQVQPATSVHRPKRPGPISYSTDFAAVLATGEASPEQEVKPLRRPPLAPAPLPEAKRDRSSRTQWALAGIASVVVATAVYGAAQWQKQDFASIDTRANGAATATSGGSKAAGAEAAPRRPQAQESAPLLPAAVRLPVAEPTELQQVIDAALLRAVPGDAPVVGTEIAHPVLTPILKPPVDPIVDPVYAAGTPVTGPSVGAPVELSTLGRPTPILAVPFGATASAQSRGATAELAPIGPPLPIGRTTTSAGRVTIEFDQEIGTGGMDEDEVESAYDGWPSRLDERGGDRPVRSGRLDGGVARAESERPDSGSSGGSGGDTGSSGGDTGTGGTGAGSGSDSGGSTGGSGTDSGGTDAGGGDSGGAGGGDAGGDTAGGDAGGGSDPGGGDSGGGTDSGGGGGDTGGGDASGGDSGGGDAGGGDAGGSDAGGGDSGGGDAGGGDAGGGDAGGGDAGGGDSGGALGGGGLGGGLGGALGGG